VWGIVEIVIACFESNGEYIVLNQSRGHQLLYDVLMITVNLIVAIEFQPDSLVDGNETCDQFDVEFQMLNKNMRQEVVKVIRHFL
jgi:hypothetical protein